MRIDTSKIKTKEMLAEEALKQATESATMGREAAYESRDGTDKEVIEAVLKMFKDRPEFAPIWEKRMKIQAENPYPVEERLS